MSDSTTETIVNRYTERVGERKAGPWTKPGKPTTNASYIFCYVYTQFGDMWKWMPRDDYAYLKGSGEWDKGMIELPHGKMVRHRNKNRFDDRFDNLKLETITEPSMMWEEEMCKEGPNLKDEEDFDFESEPNR